MTSPPQVNRLTKRNSELEASVSGLEQQSKEMSNQKRDIEQADRDRAGKVRELEKQLKQTRLEKDDFSRDLTDAQGCGVANRTFLNRSTLDVAARRSQPAIY